MSRFIQRHADITIVTNSFLKDIVEQNGGKGFVLPDKIPNLSPTGEIKLKGHTNVVFICSFSWDEPYLEVINAGNLLDKNIVIYITGDNKKATNTLPRELPENIILTGFLSECEYVNLLNAADIIIDLTTREGCLLCGAYEAISLGKPYILSKTRSLTEYFSKGCVHTDNTSHDIASSIKVAIANKKLLQEEICEYRNHMVNKWDTNFNILKKIIRF
ncbi:MAG: glycosyltransferase [Nitrospirae bacterium]|nr:glycosyltransferase [Nitrospirota bacterium]